MRRVQISVRCAEVFLETMRVRCMCVQGGLFPPCLSASTTEMSFHLWILNDIYPAADPVSDVEVTIRRAGRQVHRLSPNTCVLN